MERHHRLKQQQQALMQQAIIQEQSLYRPGLLTAPEIEPVPSGNQPPSFDSSTCRSSSYGFVHYFDCRSASLAMVWTAHQSRPGLRKWSAGGYTN